MPQTPKKNTKKDFLKLEIIFLMIYILSFFISAVISLWIDLKPTYYFWVILTVLSFCSFVCGFYIGLKKRLKGLFNAFIYLLPINLLFVGTSLIFNGFKADKNALLSFLILTVLSALGGIIGVNSRVRK